MNTNTLDFVFFSKYRYISFSLDGDCNQVVFDLLKTIGAVVFNEKNSIEIRFLLSKNKKLQESFSIFINKYHKYNPKFHKINSFLNELEEEEFFYFLPGVKKMTEKEHMCTMLELHHHNNPYYVIDFDYLLDSLNQFVGEFFDRYEIKSISSDKKICIGKGYKAHRVCRFCKLDKEIQTFKNEAHAISESLGNKLIILNEECDKCNDYFAKTIEKDIDVYLKIIGSIFKIKNKKGKVSTVKGKNFQFKLHEYEGKEIYSLIYTPKNGVDRHEDGLPKTISLEFYDKINMQNIYKALVKFSLSVIDDINLELFDRTIEWIRSDNYKENLPKIAVLLSYDNVVEQPELTVYIRKDDYTRLPFAVGEFKFTFMTFVFIIPMFKEIDDDFSIDENYTYFWDFFKMYNVRKEWEFKSFTDHVSKPFVFNINTENLNKMNCDYTEL
ncbi:TPA: HNH endonuclease [Photobacterium damselae]